MTARNYTYYDFTLSLCAKCLRRVEAKIVFQDEKVFMLKRCPEHGREKVLIATDIEYYQRCRNYLKPGEVPQKFNTETLYGCPYDCGLCPDHEQHSCLTLIEITDRCNLTCPICYAESSPTFGRHKSLDEIRKMFEIIVANEGKPDIVQLSGGEPTVHPQFFEILDIAKQMPIRHLMINTNGVKIAQDREFTARLASYMPKFEVYLQFDSFKEEVLQSLRGKDLRKIREKALEFLNEYKLSTTLVVTLKKGENDDEIGKIIEFALQQPCVRGVTFQPTQVAGRVENFDPAVHRLTLTEVRSEILRQSKIFTSDDLLPVPCNPDALAMAYALKWNGQVQPLTRMFNPDDLLNTTKNTIVFEQEPGIREQMYRIFSTSRSVDEVATDLHSLLCCLPQVKAPEITYENVFRIIIMQFIDAHNFDVRAIKRSCVHIVHPNGKIIPFETMNLFYRGDKMEQLQKLRAL